MVRLKRLMLLALPVSLLSASMARGDTPTPSTGVTRENQREERFYNFDRDRQSGGGFKDPSDLIRKLQSARNAQNATDPTDAMDAALDDFKWPEESPPEEEPVAPVANSGGGSTQAPNDLLLELKPSPIQKPTTGSEEENSEDENSEEEKDSEDEDTE